MAMKQSFDQDLSSSATSLKKASSRLNSSAPSTPSERDPSPSQTSAQKSAEPISPTLKKEYFSHILIFLGSAVGLGLLFIFALLPLAINITGAAKMSSASQPTDLTLPQTPILNAPTEFTNEATIKLSGYAQAGHSVYFLINGNSNPQHEAIVNQDGQFATNISLQEGANRIIIYSSDNNGSESDKSQVYTITLDTTAPTIEITEPENGREIVGKNNQSLTIKGTSEPKSKIYINDRVTQTNSEGEFSFNTTLDEGDNNFTIKAEDQAGNSSETTLSVKFEP